MELTEELKDLLIKTAKQLKGSARRLFMAHTVKTLGPGGASRAEGDLGWNRKTKTLGMHELESGITCVDAFGSRGRKRSEEHLPNLLRDIRAIVDGQNQTDPQFTVIQNEPTLHALNCCGGTPSTDPVERRYR